MPSYKLSKRSENDLLEIVLYGIEFFGLDKAQDYHSELSKTMQLLANNPKMGRKADNIASGVRRHEHGSHVILYEETHNSILILALVHSKSIAEI